jgi:hypothetical protein
MKAEYAFTEFEEDDRETIIWEDMLYGENYGMYVHPEYRYVHYNESMNT